MPRRFLPWFRHSDAAPKKRSAASIAVLMLLVALFPAQGGLGVPVTGGHLPNEHSGGQISAKGFVPPDMNFGGASPKSARVIASVQQTLDLANASLNPGNYRPFTCYGFQDVAVAASLHQVFVSCLFTNTLMAFNETTGIDEGAVEVGPSPMGVSFDSQNDVVFVADSAGVDVVAATTMTLRASIPIDGSPYALALDNTTQRLYVSDSESGNVTVISASNDSVVTTIVLGSGAGPLGIAYNAYNKDVYVAESDLDRIGVIATMNDSVTQTINLPGQPFGLAPDSNTGMVYVGMLSQQLVVISGLNQSVVTTLNVLGGQVALAADSHTHRLYLGSTNITVVNTTSLTVAEYIAVGVEPTGIGVDEATGRVYVADFMSSDVAVIDEGSSTVVGLFRSDPGPLGIAWNDVSRDVYVTEHATGMLIQVDGRTAAVLSSSDLAYGLTGIAANDRTGNLFVASMGNSRVFDTTATGSVIGSVQVGSLPSGVVYDSRNGYVYVANNYANTVSVINGSSGLLSGNISIPPPTGIGGGLNDIAFNPANGYLYVSVEGCVCSTPGNVTIVDGATNQIVGAILDWVSPGPSAEAIDAQNNELYVADDFSNVLWAFNASTYQFISTTPVGTMPEGIAVDPETGYVYVTNSGSGNVSVIDSSTNRVIGSIDVGLRPMGVTFDPDNGNIYVVNEDSGTLSVIGQPTYKVSFNESGLPIGTNWSVTLAGVTNSTKTTALSFQEPNGTYDYTAATTDKKYAPAPAGGSIGVSGTSVNETVTFYLVTYPITFTETGLAPGTEWWVNLTGFVTDVDPWHNSTTTGLGFDAPNGTYSFSVGPVVGYTVNLSVGSITVNGAAIQRSITFTPKPGVVTVLGLPPTEGYALLGGLVAAVLLAIVIVVVLTRRKRRAKPPAAVPAGRAP